MFVDDLVEGHVDVKEPLAAAVYGRLMTFWNASINSTVSKVATAHSSLRTLHRYGVQRGVRWDHLPDFGTHLHALFPQFPYVAWMLCSGYPPKTPWVEEMRHTHQWEAFYEKTFLPIFMHSAEEIQLLCDLGSATQIMDVLENYVCHDKTFSVGTTGSKVWREDFFVYGMAFLGYLHQWRDGHNAHMIAHLTRQEKRSGSHLWNDTRLLELSYLRHENLDAVHVAFPELAFMDTASEWASYRAQFRQEAVNTPIAPPGGDFTLG